ncbi:YdcF family protein [bacterium]|nr:YdcF family protein [bacterium]MDY4583397.1 YdcF family protein [Candidatus Faecousia sp.]
MDFLQPLQVIWDYLGMHQEPQKADCIVGFGNFNDNIARRAAQLYHQGYADRILFTGGLGRNTRGLLPETEAARFARVAEECGVPGDAILREDRSTNTKENILFTRDLLTQLGLPRDHILGVHQPFMERRICAALGVYWPEVRITVTSPQVTIPEYLADAKRQGITENAAVSVIVGDFQRMDLYAQKGYQLPQEIPEEAWEAFRQLVAMGFDKQLAK